MLTFLGVGRGCNGALTRPSTRHILPKNFEKTALRKRWGIFTVKMPFFSGKTAEMLWEYMDLTVLPFFETWSAHIFGG